MRRIPHLPPCRRQVPDGYAWLVGGDAGRPRVRLAELVAALSLGVDLGFGPPMEHVLRRSPHALAAIPRLRSCLPIPERGTMPRLSQDSVPDVQDAGPAVDRSGDLDDITVDFVTIRQSHALAPLLRGLPGDSCQCPHWGHLPAGTITVSYADRDETYQVGDAFYMTPGHVPAAAAGTEFI